MYKLTQSGVRRFSDNVDIPNNLANRDWRKYQEWLKVKGNVPEPMDIIDPWVAKRQERNLILQSTDWTVLPDAPLTDEEKTAWKAYRQKLRDLPQDYTKIEDIVMPSTALLSKSLY